MPSFSRKSMDALDTCDHRLQRLFFDVISRYDCSVLEGFRTPERQKQLFEQKRTKVLHSKHNKSPSMAVDVAPYLPGRGIPWPQVPTWFKHLPPEQRGEIGRYIKDLNQFYHFVGYVLGIADYTGVPLRSGADWDRDHDISDQSFNDLVHFEIYETETLEV